MHSIFSEVQVFNDEFYPLFDLMHQIDTLSKIQRLITFLLNKENSEVLKNLNETISVLTLGLVSCISQRAYLLSSHWKKWGQILETLTHFFFTFPHHLSSY